MKLNTYLRSEANSINGQTGAAAVELAYALFFIIGLFMICFEYFSIYGVKQRVNYATYMAERSLTVDGNPVATANALNHGGQVVVGGGVEVKKFLDLPVNLEKPWGGANMNFEVSTEINMPTEPTDSGDNAF